MTSLTIDYNALPSLAGKTALVTGGASGIGLAAARTLARKGASVHILDLDEPTCNLDIGAGEGIIYFRRCDVTSWDELRDVFERVPSFEYVFANAGVSEERDYFADTVDDGGRLLEPSYAVLDTNVRAVLNTVKLGWSLMRKRRIAGSIVITTSATAYAPEQSLPVYSGGKLALVGIIRALRSVMIKDDITINGVAPSATHTKLLPADLAAPIAALGLPVSSADFVALALVYSATADQSRRVEVYGKESEPSLWKRERWNGRVILTLGESYTELEEPISDLRRFWLGESNLKLCRRQQAATDAREFCGEDFLHRKG